MITDDVMFNAVLNAMFSGMELAGGLNLILRTVLKFRVLGVVILFDGFDIIGRVTF